MQSLRAADRTFRIFLRTTPAERTIHGSAPAQGNWFGLLERKSTAAGQFQAKLYPDAPRFTTIVLKQVLPAASGGRNDSESPLLKRDDASGDQENQ